MFRSSKGRDLVDATGRYIWKDNRIKVNCYVRRYWWGYNQPYAVVTAEFGTVYPYSCDGIRAATYDPYSTDCSGSTGSGGGESSTVDCQTEHIRIEISYDGGQTWSLWWEGWVTTCA